MINLHRFLTVSHHLIRRNRPLTALYLTVSILNFGLALVGIFIPIYILGITGNFFYLPAFYAVAALAALIALLFSPGILARWGAARSVLWANVFRVLNLAALLLLPQFPLLLWVAAILEGLIVPAFWVTYHVVFAVAGKEGEYGKEVAWMGVLVSIVSALAPLLGGLVVSFFGFAALYVLGMIIILLSSIPIFWVGDHLGFRPIPPRTILAQTFSREWRPLLTGFFGVRLEATVATIIWPLFLFVITRSFTDLGAVTSVLTIVGVLLMVTAGRLNDRVGSRRVFPWAALFAAPFWLAAGFLPNLTAVVLLSIYRGAVSPFYGISFESFFYSLTHADPFLAVIQREVSLHLSLLVSVLLVALLWVFFPANWPVLLAPAAVGTLIAIRFVSANLKKE